MKAYEHLVDFSLLRGCTISVWDGEEMPVRKSTDKELILEHIRSVEEAEIWIYENGEKVGWALIIPFGLEDNETVADFTMTPFMNYWDEEYTRTTDET